MSQNLNSDRLWAHLYVLNVYYTKINVDKFEKLE